MPTNRDISQYTAQKRREGYSSQELARLAGIALFPSARAIYDDAYEAALENRLLNIAEQVLQQEEDISKKGNTN